MNEINRSIDHYDIIRLSVGDQQEINFRHEIPTLRGSPQFILIHWFTEYPKLDVVVKNVAHLILGHSCWGFVTPCFFWPISPLLLI